MYVQIEIDCEIAMINTTFSENQTESVYHVSEDEKWLEFCKKHHFHPIKDAHGKIYDLYLRLCAEGLI